ncbi:MAG: hypothetical protein MUC50_07570 [Myxococcota bacterium]|jgi:hypothetical protein|nr:hypothetical protein [Myxococcota bacterium]
MKRILFWIPVSLFLATGCDKPTRTEPLPEYRTTSSVPGKDDAYLKVDVPPGEDPILDLSVSEASKQYLLRYGRFLCDNNAQGAAALAEPDELKSVKAPLLLYYFDKQGGVRDRVRIDDPNLSLRQKLDKGAPAVCDGVIDGYLHLQVVTFTSRLPNFGIKGLFDWRAYEPWVNGIVYEYKGQRAELDPIQTMVRNIDAKEVRTALCKELKLDPKKAPELNDLVIEIYSVVHFGEAYPTRRFANYFRGNEVFTADQVTKAVVDERLRWIAKWYKANVENGEVQYEYSVSDKKYRNEKRTMVRSTMATWVLNRLAYYLKDDELKVLGNQVIEYYLNNYFNIDRSLTEGKIVPSARKLASGDTVAGRYTSASFIATAILERDDWKERRKTIDLLMAFAMGYKRPDGYIWTPFGQQQYFEPGQLLVGVSAAYHNTQDSAYKTYFDEVYGAYEKALYESMHLGNGLYIPYAPAWFTQPTADMYRQTKANRYRNFIYRINDRVAKLYDLNARDQLHYDLDGVLSPKRDFFGNTSIVAACLESLIDGAITAKLDGDTARYDAYTKVIRRTVAFLLRAQFLPENTYYVEHRERVLGGFKRDMIDTTSWMDNVWHLTSALVKLQKFDLLEPMAPLAAAPATAESTDTQAPGTDAPVKPTN